MPPAADAWPSKGLDRDRYTHKSDIIRSILQLLPIKSIQTSSFRLSFDLVAPPLSLSLTNVLKLWKYPDVSGSLEFKEGTIPRRTRGVGERETILDRSIKGSSLRETRRFNRSHGMRATRRSTIYLENEFVEAVSSRNSPLVALAYRLPTHHLTYCLEIVPFYLVTDRVGPATNNASFVNRRSDEQPASQRIYNGHPYV